jgi:cbb3-type cytochrome oxidase subunit 3
MKKSSVQLFALLIVAVMMSAATVIAVSDSNRNAQDGSAARIEADWTGLYLIDTSSPLSGPSPSFQQMVSTGAVIDYSLTAPAGAPKPLSQLNITWRLEDDLNATMFKYGADISCIWMEQAVHKISVTYYDATNAGNIGRQYITVNVMSDFDNDGIPDVWERQYFGNLGTADSHLRDPDGVDTDADGDGWTDLEEYANGTDPTKPNAKPGFFEQYWWLFMAIALILVVLLILWFVIMPKTKAKRDEEDRKKIAAAVDVEKSLLGLDDLEDKPKK